MTSRWAGFLSFAIVGLVVALAILLDQGGTIRPIKNDAKPNSQSDGADGQTAATKNIGDDEPNARSPEGSKDQAIVQLSGGSSAMSTYALGILAAVGYILKSRFPAKNGDRLLALHFFEKVHMGPATLLALVSLYFGLRFPLRLALAIDSDTLDLSNKSGEGLAFLFSCQASSLALSVAFLVGLFTFQALRKS